MEYPNPIKITNWSIEANLSRNLRRLEVDKLFKKADLIENSDRYKNNKSKLDKKRLNNHIEDYRNEAKQLWRKIITETNQLN